VPVVVISLELEPRRLRTLETFTADDPWTGGSAAWDLDLHKMVPKGASARGAPEGVGALWGKDVYALRSRAGIDHFLPEALGELWRRQRVPSASLPRLLAEIEPALRSGDYAPLLHLKAHRWLAAIFGVLALVMAGVAARAVLAGSKRPMSRLPLAQWLARPQIDGEDLVTDRPVTVAGTATVAFEARLPPNLFALPADRWVLAWFPAGQGHRLLLAAEEQARALPLLALAGVTLRPESIGVPPAALAQLRARVPDLDTSLVTGLFWTWTDVPAGGRLVAVFFGGMALTSALGAAAIYLMIAVRQARRRRQMAWLLARL
jgi:hypothetical protein